MNKIVVKNFIFAFGAQIVSLLSSIAVTFFVSSLIGVEQFGYWQLFLTYVSYVSITRLGITDGLYLRLGGKEYVDLDFDLLSRERRFFCLFQLFISVILIILIANSSIGEERKFVLLSCAVCIFIVNANGYLIYILQAVNKTSIYSISVILQNVTWFIAVGIIVIFKIYSFKIIVLMYILGHLLAGIYLIFNSKDIIKYRKKDYKIVLKDILENMSCGTALMISTYAGSLIIAGCRMVVDYAWGVEVFSVFSFALTLSNLVLTFINQTSIVVFPALRKVSDEKIVEVYITLRNGLSLILPLVMLGYLPIVLIVNYFLPQYVPSLTFVPIFLPICSFDGKMQMMCSSFFKSMRKEKELLLINITTLVGSILIACFGSFIIRDTMFVALGILFVVAGRSIFSELLLAKWMNVKIKIDLAQDIILVLLFVVGATVLSPYYLAVIFAIVYVFFLFINRKKVNQMLLLRKR